MTKWFVLGAVALILVYDIAAYNLWGVASTISRVTLGWANELPIVPLAVGVVVGHLFWPQPKHKE